MLLLVLETYPVQDALPPASFIGASFYSYSRITINLYRLSVPGLSNDSARNIRRATDLTQRVAAMSGY